ncbi:hypothetical protein FE784_00100 [Paenibacillus hemerocallicola]|uniref:Uncharacterized protein n=1 Tax=Paenibacillus hemerocallicola TaxID=1172614 RepID=A0A5C4TGM3_9BACL|nr:hypothetical protein [Paenibacillus hemerocallicola]TNJ68105.1 hypothetical protein FE784_00100 [Paenibacillus hemerocallicola]
MIKIICAAFMFVTILTGCETDKLKDENIKLSAQLDEANRQVAKLEKNREDLVRLNEDLQNKEERLKSAASAKQQLEIDLNWYKNAIKDVMSIKNFDYEVVSQSVSREPYDKVVYIKNVPELNKDQTIYLLKAALSFFDDQANIVSFWRDRDMAMRYASGKYDPEEGPSGWSGFDYRFGSIINDEPYPRLRQYNSRDDSQLIEFGKYSSK